MSSKKKRFTLIELLVVIAIISVLASILLPALNKAKGSAKKLLCLNNMKQLGVGIISYADSNNSYLPDAYLGRYGVQIWPYLASSDLTSSEKSLSTLTLANTRAVKSPFYCPNGFPPSSSPLWLGGSTESYRSAPNYLATGYMWKTAQGNGNMSPGWIVWEGDGWNLACSSRPIHKVIQGSAILGEGSYRNVDSSGGFNSCSHSIALGQSSWADWSNQRRSTAGTSWDNHDTYANFLFIGGNASSVRYTGTSFYQTDPQTAWRVQR